MTLKILIIRRDNIGDLVCTTPLFSALRKAHPDAWIGVLTNSYNAPVLAGNPDVDAVFAYRKAKHRTTGESRLGIWMATAALLWRLRRLRLDLVLCASPGAQRFARLLGARRVVKNDRRGVGHEVEITFQFITALGLRLVPGPLTVVAPPDERLRAQGLMANLGAGPVIGLHISARKVLQRWPKERFVALAQELHRHHGARLMLFWSPGSETNPLHPGDDEKAAWIVERTRDLPLLPFPTQRLIELMGGLAACDFVICSDGGAMHIAAGLGKPIVCFFGNSDAARWHPWGVPYELLQTDSRDVNDITVDAALAAFKRLQARL
ncbi:MAG: glycosyltransferase family 9 protein [Rhodocyclaceae bacterium]|nr:glycosyltransferase family 9 protein [Rhodocyclaceae bacterium]